MQDPPPNPGDSGKHTGMLSTDQLEEEFTLLRLLGENMASVARGRNNPAVVSGRSGFVALDGRRPRESAAWHVLCNCHR